MKPRLFNPLGLASLVAGWCALSSGCQEQIISEPLPRVLNAPSPASVQFTYSTGGIPLKDGVTASSVTVYVMYTLQDQQTSQDRLRWLMSATRAGTADNLILEMYLRRCALSYLEQGEQGALPRSVRVLRVEPKVALPPQAARRSSWWFTDMAEMEYSDTSAAVRSTGEVLFDLPGGPEAESEMDWHPLDRPGFDAWWQLLCARTNVLSMLGAAPTTMPSTQPQAR